MSKVSQIFPNGRPLNPSESGYSDQVFAILTMAPPEKRINKNAGNSLYVPISVTEELLDFLFPGCWSFEFRKSDVIANEICMDGELVISAPGYTRRMWGSGAAMMQMSAGSAITDLDKKIKNTLSKDYPHAKAEALRNAAKSLGTVFGRSLNRKNEDGSAYDAATILPEDIVSDINDCDTPETLKEYYLGLPQPMRNNTSVIAAFSARKTALTKTATTGLDL
jgi:hypothetical protein